MRTGALRARSGGLLRPDHKNFSHARLILLMPRCRTNDPWNLGRPLRTNYPLLTAPDLGDGIIDIPSSVTVNSLASNFRRGYIQSWNFTLQKELPWGFTGQAGYAGTPGGGKASEPYYQRSGETP